mgnify:CR=1 FL=1|jgi:hypothetical protein
MNTAFTLIYYDFPKSTNNLSAGINGPILLQSFDDAINNLFAYVEKRMNENLVSLFDTFFENTPINSDSTFDDTLDYLRELSTDHKKTFIDDYFKYASDEETYAGYSIDHLPVGTLVDDLGKADAIEIDGNFIRYFHFELDEDSDVVLDASVINNIVRHSVSSFFPSGTSCTTRH